jgi:hypothetical protein
MKIEGSQRRRRGYGQARTVPIWNRDCDFCFFGAIPLALIFPPGWDSSSLPAVAVAAKVGQTSMIGQNAE